VDEEGRREIGERRGGGNGIGKGGRNDELGGRERDGRGQLRRNRH